MNLGGSSQTRVVYYPNDSQKLLPGMNILVQLYYHHIFKEQLIFKVLDIKINLYNHDHDW